MSKISIPPAPSSIIQRLNSFGYEAYIVGGCVRDSIMGIIPHDWDICTSATPQEMKRCFSGYRIIDTGIKHGTVTIRIEDEGYEVTTYRVDGKYSDGRHPDEVRFTTRIEEDLSRRDFTMNAIAYHPEKGFVDPFDGCRDIANDCIRAVGRAKVRFEEDALRILRAVRFASVFGFKVEDATSNAMYLMRYQLTKISAERIQTELIKLLEGPYATKMLIMFSDVISTIIPELATCVGFEQKNKYHMYTVYDHIAHAVGNYTETDKVINLALLLHDIGKPSCHTVDEEGHGHFYGHTVPSSEMADEVLARLKIDNATRKAVVELILYHDTTIIPTVKAVRRMLNKIGEEQYRRLLKLQRADILAHKPIPGDTRFDRLVEVEKIIDDVIAQEQCFSMKDLAVNGQDILNMGVAQGPLVGQVLNHLLQLVIEGSIENIRGLLINEAARFLWP